MLWVNNKLLMLWVNNKLLMLWVNNKLFQNLNILQHLISEESCWLFIVTG